MRPRPQTGQPFSRDVMGFKTTTALLRWNSHSLHPFKACQSMVFSIFTEVRAHHHNFRTFPSPQSYALAVTPAPSPPNP